MSWMILFYSIPIPIPDLLECSILLRNSDGCGKNNAIDGACIYRVGLGPARRYLDTRLGNGGGQGVEMEMEMEMEKIVLKEIIPSNEPKKGSSSFFFLLFLIIFAIGATADDFMIRMVRQVMRRRC